MKVLIVVVFPLLAFVGTVACSNSTARRVVRAGLMQYHYPPWVELKDPSQAVARRDSDYVGGFHVDFYREMGVVGNFDVRFVPMTDPDHMNNFTGTAMHALDRGEIDMAFDTNYDLHADYGDRYLFTTPMITVPHVVLTRKSERDVGMWQVFMPFDWSVWVATLASVVFGTLVLWALAVIDSGRCTLRALPSYAYHTLAAMLGGEEFDLYHCVAGHAAAGRVYRVGLLFFVLIFGATYTANLAAFLTRPAFKVHGPQTMAQLRQATVCYRWRAQAQWNGLERYARRVLLPPAELDVQGRLPWAREMLRLGECDAIVELQTNAKGESLQHCDTLAYGNDIAFLPVIIYNIMRGPEATGGGRNDTAAARVSLWRDVSRAVPQTQKEPSYEAMVARNMRIGESCAPARDSDGSMSSITARQMSGAFVVFAAFGAASVALAVARKAGYALLPRGGKDGNGNGSGSSGIGRGREPRSHEEVHNERLDRKLDEVLTELRRLRGVGGSGGGRTEVVTTAVTALGDLEKSLGAVGDGR